MSAHEQEIQSREDMLFGKHSSTERTILAAKVATSHIETVKN